MYVLILLQSFGLAISVTLVLSSAAQRPHPRLTANYSDCTAFTSFHNDNKDINLELQSTNQIYHTFLPSELSLNIVIHLTLRGPFIVIYSYNKSQQDALVLKSILVISTCFGQTYCPSSGVLILYSQQLVFVMLVMLTVCLRGQDPS